MGLIAYGLLFVCFITETWGLNFKLSIANFLGLNIISLFHLEEKLFCHYFICKLRKSGIYFFSDEQQSKGYQADSRLFQ